MKLTKKLIPALGMLVLSACMLVTSTFAWFSMNDTVKATNMTVTAKGEQVYLQIVNEVGSFTNGAAQTSAEAKTPNATLLPTNVYKVFDDTDPTDYDGGADMVWVTAIGKSNTDGSVSGSYEDKTSSAEGTLYLANTFKIRLDPTAGAANSSASLKVSAVSVTGTVAEEFSDCLSVLVVCTYDGTTQGDLWNYQSGTFAHDTNTKATLTTDVLAKNEEATVTVYVFFNGDNANCTLAKLAAAAGESYGVEVTFTCV